MEKDVLWDYENLIFELVEIENTLLIVNNFIADLVDEKDEKYKLYTVNNFANKYLSLLIMIRDKVTTIHDNHEKILDEYFKELRNE
ncbi:hypothetical protein CG018_07655 [Gemella sp. ND 6198]|uniref:hypothetical protein n=1 Tax=Gemella sp. ND 6198 TaxID=2040624 RepID=UPI000E09F112|nr:hypothetical protein [Gemella sp. ND 6198]AXI27286.1 hypothetical protein CG018_07655 [Gemella sp. ND 6198]